MTTLTQSRQELESRIIDAASQDSAFRQHLLDDPKAALTDALPSEITISVLEEQPGHHYLVLSPVAPALDAIPLGDLELALVGGGRTLRPTKTPCIMDVRTSSRKDYRTGC